MIETRITELQKKRNNICSDTSCQPILCEHTAADSYSSAYLGQLPQRSQVSFLLRQIPHSTDFSLSFPIKQEHAEAALLFIVGLQIGT